MTRNFAARLEIDALRALCAIEDHRGITRAALFLGLSQSAVSHKIQRLEKSLDCDLLSRRSNAPLFTDAGRDLLAYAKRILDIHENALRSLSKSTLRGEIRVGMVEDTAGGDLLCILTRFGRLHPFVSMRFQVKQSLDLLEMLANDQIDLAIVQLFKYEIRPADIVLMEDRLYWMKSPGLHLKPTEPVPYLSFDENSQHSRWVEDVAQEDGTVFETVLECPSAAGLVSAVCGGLGVALLGGRHLSAGMEIIDNHFVSPPDVAYVVRTLRRTVNDAVKALVQDINQVASRNGKLRLV